MKIGIIVQLYFVKEITIITTVRSSYITTYIIISMHAWLCKMRLVIRAVNKYA